MSDEKQSNKGDWGYIIVGILILWGIMGVMDGYGFFQGMLLSVLFGAILFIIGFIIYSTLNTKN